MKNFYYDLEDNDGYVYTYYIIMVTSERYLLQAIGSEDWYTLARLTESESNWVGIMYNETALDAICYDRSVYLPTLSQVILRRQVR